MFEVGFTEIILICGLALIVLGPERLPKLAMQLGRWVGRAKAMARQLRDQLDQEVNIKDIVDSDPPWKATTAPADAPVETAAPPEPDDGRSHANAPETPAEESLATTEAESPTGPERGTVTEPETQPR